MSSLLFTETALADAFVVESDLRADRRGYFARTFCAREFEEHGLKPTVAQANVAYNYRKGTLRGMHFRPEPPGETKLVRCTRGAIYDVIVDLRPNSPTFLSSVAEILTAENARALYVPDGFAHGYQTLADDTEVTYLMGDFYVPDADRGFRYNDPLVRIRWPEPVTEISDRDRQWPDLDPVSLLPREIPV